MVNRDVTGLQGIRSASRTEMKKKSSWNMKKNWQKYLMLSIPVIMVFIFSYAPMYGILISFQKFNIMKGVWGSPWVGLDNFKYAFALPRFWHVVFNTLRLSVLSLVMGFPIPILFAILISEMKNVRITKCVQTFSYLPHFLSTAIIGGIVYNMCSPDTGVFNQIIRSLGFDNAPFLTDSTWWIFTYIISGIWETMGWGSIIYIAAITNINPEMFEAAIVDGCSRIKRIWYITLPSIKSTIVLMLTLSMGGIINVGFDRPWVFGNTMISDVSEVIGVFVYNVGLGQSSYDIATVVGLFQSVVGAVMVLTVNAIAKTIGEEGLW